MRGEVDAVQEVGRDSVEFMERSSNIATYPTVQAFYLTLLFNHRHSALKNVEVRRAIVEALDRGAIIERAMRGKGQIADGPIWPFHWAYPNNPPQYRSDSERAATRLDRAGLALPTTGRQGEQRKRFSFKCIVYNEDPQFERIALLIQRQLFDVGIVMEIELLDLKTLVERSSAGNYDALLIQMYAGRAMDYTYRFWRSGESEAQMVNSGYSGADDLLDKLRLSITDERTRQVLGELVARFHDDVPAAFLAWTEVTRAVSTRFNVGGSSSQDPLFNIWQWRPLQESESR
jgi:peptide/nickel transport system substrate-binding protein